jgi:hypothetical protein
MNAKNLKYKGTEVLVCYSSEDDLTVIEENLEWSEDNNLHLLDDLKYFGCHRGYMWACRKDSQTIIDMHSIENVFNENEELSVITGYIDSVLDFTFGMTKTFIGSTAIFCKPDHIELAKDKLSILKKITESGFSILFYNGDQYVYQLDHEDYFVSVNGGDFTDWNTIGDAMVYLILNAKKN